MNLDRLQLYMVFMMKSKKNMEMLIHGNILQMFLVNYNKY